MSGDDDDDDDSNDDVRWLGLGLYVIYYFDYYFYKSNYYGPQFSAAKFDKFRGEYGKFRGSARQGRWNSAAHRS